MLKQIFAVSAMNIKSLKGRFWPSLVIVVGMACVVAVLLSMMSVSVGIVGSIERAAEPDLAQVISHSARNNFNSKLPRGSLPIIADAPGIARDKAGKPLADAYVVMNVPMFNKVLKHKSGMGLAGLGPQGIALKSNLKLIAGRQFRPGARELMVGHAAQGQFANTNIGDKVTLPDGQWLVVGAFTTGDAWESNFLADRDTVMTATRKNTYNAVLVRLINPAAFETFHRAVTTNRALSVDAERMSTYVARSTGEFSGLLNGVAYAVATVMAIGAMFGALNTMYAAVGTRSREIATLRALGFGSTSVVISVIFEALLLALAGALIGAAIAWFMFDGNQKAFGSDVFNLSVSPGLVLTGILWAMAVGLIGGLFPSIRAARLPVVDALRAT